MKYIWEYDWFFIPTAMFLGSCGVLAMIVPYGHEILFFNNLRYEPFNSCFQFLTYCGEIWAFLFFGVAALFWRPRYALMIALVGLLSMPVMYLLKDAIGVDRPITYFEKKAALDNIILVPSTYMNRGQTSFPSGHTMAAFALFSLLTRMAGQKYERWGLAFALLAVLVGISRIFLAQHFLVDVIAGALLGLLLSGTVWWAAARFLPESKP
ncbi:MAG: phosphatase PAP2 family protein [Phycisphaerae bacterium]|nr:phosphatase PAP2 family protein [Saprospiraceae bacterium]